MKKNLLSLLLLSCSVFAAYAQNIGIASYNNLLATRPPEPVTPPTTPTP